MEWGEGVGGGGGGGRPGRWEPQAIVGMSSGVHPTGRLQDIDRGVCGERPEVRSEGSSINPGAIFDGFWSNERCLRGN